MPISSFLRLMLWPPLRRRRGDCVTRKPVHAVSLFSNCGAGDLGYAKAGFRFDVMAELDPRRLEVCLLNHAKAHGVPGDLRKTWPLVVDEYRDRNGRTPPALLAACPPCQGMSSTRSHRGKEADPDAGMKDARNLLVTVIAKAIRELKPRAVVIENVQAFLTRQVRHPRTGQPVSASRWLVDELARDYAAYPFLTNLCDYGVPQSRKRTFLTFFRRDEEAVSILAQRQKVPYPIPRYAPDFGGEPITVRQAIKSFELPPLDAASSETANSAVGDGLHAVPVWPGHRYAMVASIPPHTGRSAWENKHCPRCGLVDVGDEDSQCSQCYEPLLRPVVRLAEGSYRLITGFRSSTYRRMRSDSPAATITTGSGHIGSNHTIHPFENRLLSPLECALLQTLPRNFKWGSALERWGHSNVRQMIGEAVPPMFTLLHGRAIRGLLEGKRRMRLYPLEGRRSARAARKLGRSDLVD